MLKETSEKAKLSLLNNPLLVGRSTGSIESKVGEFKLFVFTIRFEEAKAYRKSYGAYLRLNQWEDLTVEVWI